tara:strand:- start:461 stop:712 length:252 start_codon:yes stop_codon:yes gene_type:complete
MAGLAFRIFTGLAQMSITLEVAVDETAHKAVIQILILVVAVLAATEAAEVEMLAEARELQILAAAEAAEAVTKQTGMPAVQEL